VLQRESDRLLAEHGYPLLQQAREQVRVRIGGESRDEGIRAQRGQVLPGDGRGAEFPGERRGPVRGAVDDDDVGDPRIGGEIHRADGPHAPGSDDDDLHACLLVSTLASAGSV
jgi:hypothetical protein